MNASWSTCKRFPVAGKRSRHPNHWLTFEEDLRERRDVFTGCAIEGEGAFSVLSEPSFRVMSSTFSVPALIATEKA